MKKCVDENVSVIIGAPFCSGLLATGLKDDAKYNYGAVPIEVQNKVIAIQDVCEAHGVNLPAAALQFPLAHPAVTSVIPGAVKQKKVLENKKYFEEIIPDEFWSDLKDQDLIDSGAPTP